MAVKWVKSSDTFSQKYENNFSELILIAKDEKSSNEDKKLLYATGFRNFRIFTSGVSALEYILKEKEDNFADYTCLLMMHEEFYDIEAFIFLSLLSIHPLGDFFPKAVLTFHHSSDASYNFENKKIKYSSLGCFKVLNRPLSPKIITDLTTEAFSLYQETVKNFVKSHQEIESTNQEIILISEEKRKQFELTLAKYVFIRPSTLTFEEAYLKGVEKFNNKIYNQSIEYFKRASALQSDYQGDALYYLFQIFLKKKDSKNVRLTLTNLCQYCVENNDWAKLEEGIEASKDLFKEFTHPILKIFEKEVNQKNTHNIAAILTYIHGYFSVQELSTAIINGLDKNELPKSISIVLYNYPGLVSKVKEELLQIRNQKKLAQKRRQAMRNKGQGLSDRTDNISISSNSDSHNSFVISENSLLKRKTNVEQGRSEQGLSKNNFGFEKKSEQAINQKPAKKSNKSTPRSEYALDISNLKMGNGEGEELFSLIQDEEKPPSFFGGIVHIIKKVVKETK